LSQPYVDAGINTAEISDLASELGLEDVAECPQCLTWQAAFRAAHTD